MRRMRVAGVGRDPDLDPAGPFAIPVFRENADVLALRRREAGAPPADEQREGAMPS